MLIGLPGSGKSTFIQHLNNSNYVVLSTDNILTEWGAEKGLNYNEAFKKFPFKQVEAEFKRRYKAALKDKKDIILDQTNLTQKSRTRKLTQVPIEYQKIGIVFKINKEELDRRLKKRAIEEGKSIPEHVMKQMAASFSYPSKSEFDEIKEVNS